MKLNKALMGGVGGKAAQAVVKANPITAKILDKAGVKVPGNPKAAMKPGAKLGKKI
jgi:hypothetical protein